MTEVTGGNRLGQRKLSKTRKKAQSLKDSSREKSKTNKEQQNRECLLEEAIQEQES